MKRKWIFVLLIIPVAVAWVKINDETFPPPPESYTVLKTVNLKFNVTSMDGTRVEMALNQGRGSNNLFCLFEQSDDWVKGNFGLVLKDMSDRTLLKGNSGKKPDISRFEKDNKGSKVTTYSFDQSLVEDGKGGTFMQLIYSGPPMPLIESLKVDKNISLPRHIAAQFVNNKSVIFQAGKYGLDKKINGFWIPVKIQ